MIWVCAHLPQMGLEMFHRAHPAARRKPTVVIDDHKVHLMNHRAEEGGVVLGSSLATANSVVSDLVHCSRDEKAEREHLESLIPTCYRLTPRVSLSFPYDLMLEISGSLKLFGGITPVVRMLKHSLRRVGHKTSIGVAHTPCAARVLAHAQITTSLPEYPDAQKVRDNAMECVRDVSLKYAELQPVAIERLFNMGIRSFGELIDLPRHELGKRFTKDLLNYLGRLTGVSFDPQEYVAPAERFCSDIHFLEPVQDKRSLGIHMNQLVSELAQWLRARHLGVMEIRWEFSPFHGTGTSVPVRFAHPRLRVPAILEFSELALEPMELPKEVMSISLAATRVDSLSQSGAAEKDLLGVREVRSVMPNDLLDRLTARLGVDSWQLLRNMDDHRPEYAWSPSGVQDSNGKASKCVQPLLTPGCRPLWLFEPPLLVKRKYFELVKGPERIQSGWWGEHLARDYFVARHESGALCWLFLNEQGWFQHGYFS